MSEMRFVIIQAAGKGTRLLPLTKNKAKAMVSVKGIPMILKTMQRMPHARFIVIADYQSDVLKRYLGLFAKQYDYSIVDISDSGGEGSARGIGRALELVPDNTPFLITWCDLFYEDRLYPEGLELGKKNYIGLSDTFPCRWSFKDGKLLEEKSDTSGVAGIFLFKDKREIGSFPSHGETCRYLQGKGVGFEPFLLKDVFEIGTLETHRRITDSFANTRPFNSIAIEGDKVIKRPVNKQGEDLAAREIAWYKEVEGKNLSFIPTVFSYAPLTLQKINGSSLFKESLSEAEKKDIFESIVENISALHALGGKEISDARKNNNEAIIEKTKKRLDSISSLVPYMKDDHIYVNGKKCINFYKRWELVEAMCASYLSEHRYKFIHGDITFSNIIYDKNINRAYFIDPRGYYGNEELYGDPDYDWAKLYYSIAGNYDQFNAKNFSLDFEGEGAWLAVASSGWEGFGEKLLSKTGRDRRKIRLFHAVIWLSLASYAWDDYDSICGAFYNGISLMQELYEETL